MSLSKRKFTLTFLFLWLLCYLVVYVLFSKNTLSLICVYLVFTIIMYVIDIKYKKWGLLNKIENVGRFNPSNLIESSQSTLYESTAINTLSRFVAISIVLLTFTIGYILMSNTKLNIDIFFAMILLIISTICFLFALESQSTSVVAKWKENEKGKLTTFRRWNYIIGWHALFLYVLLIISLIEKSLYLIGILLYTSVLCYYYFSLD